MTDFIWLNIFLKTNRKSLIAPGIDAEHLNDDVLGDLLDTIHVYGSTRLYSELAFEIGKEHNLLGCSNHLDTSTLSLFGRYEKDENEAREPSSLEITYGHSKDHRPDLKQVTLSLTVNGKASFPLWYEALDGNSSDKTSFHNTIAKVTEFQKQLELKEPSIWVADSALYAAEKLLTSPVIWITKVPETIGDAKALCQAPEDEFEWIDIGNGYRTVSLCSNYGGLPQRWLLIHSQQALKRQTETFYKQLNKIEHQLETTVWHLKSKLFACQADAKSAFLKLKKSSKYHNLSYELQEILKHRKKGRPKKGQQPQVVGYKLLITKQRDQSAIQTTLNCKGRFILATNQLEVESLNDKQIFDEYKEQSHAEAGFRFLKDPWFMLDSVFLKNPSRIESLMVIMTLCLMVYNVGQHWLRQQLEQHDETVPNQAGKPIQNPTLRWVFRLLQGITLVSLIDVDNRVQQFVTNIDELSSKIIRYFGDIALKIYGFASVNPSQMSVKLSNHDSS